MIRGPSIYKWDGEAMVPLPRFAKLCDKQFVVGLDYRLDVAEERSRRSHDHFFATVDDCWHSLPECYGDRFATSDHLRKWCLIKAGWRDERSIVAASHEEALRLAAFIRPMDEYAVIVVMQATIVVYTAKSQSIKAMGKKDFQASKQAVLDIIDGMIETRTERESSPSIALIPAYEQQDAREKEPS
jgi:hypothetical protein